MDAVNALGVWWSPSEPDCPVLTAAPSPRARTEVRGWGRGGKQRTASRCWPWRQEAAGTPLPGGQVQDLGLEDARRVVLCRLALFRHWSWGPCRARGVCMPPHQPVATLCLGWFRQPSRSCGPLGTRDPSACIHQASWNFPIL